jgi:hypothetical protein
VLGSARVCVGMPERVERVGRIDIELELRASQ